jgi:hypothetical protein
VSVLRRFRSGCVRDCLPSESRSRGEIRSVHETGKQRDSAQPSASGKEFDYQFPEQMLRALVPCLGGTACARTKRVLEPTHLVRRNRYLRGLRG